MTREEAITILKDISWQMGSVKRWENIEAIDMAIEALSQPIVAKCYEIDKDRIYCSPEVADKVFKALHEDTNVQNMHNGDLISRADAIELLTKIVFDEPPYLDSETLCRLYAEEQINKIPSADADWIPCSERLPKKGEVVLITNGKGNVRCGQYRSEHDVRGETHYWWWKGKTIESVLAWKPLPTPYKGGDPE